MPIECGCARWGLAVLGEYGSPDSSSRVLARIKFLRKFYMPKLGTSAEVGTLGVKNHLRGLEGAIIVEVYRYGGR